MVATKGRKAGGLPGRRLGDVSPSDGRVFVITLRGLARATIHSVDTPPGKGYPTAMFTRRLDVQPRRGRTVVKRCLCVCPLFPSLAPREVAGFWALVAMCGHVCAVDCVLCWGLLGDCWKRLRACCCCIGNLWLALMCAFHTAVGEEGSERVNTLMGPFRASMSKFLQVSRHAPPPAPPPPHTFSLLPAISQSLPPSLHRLHSVYPRPASRTIIDSLPPACVGQVFLSTSGSHPLAGMAEVRGCYLNAVFIPPLESLF